MSWGGWGGNWGADWAGSYQQTQPVPPTPVCDCPVMTPEGELTGCVEMTKDDC